MQVQKKMPRFAGRAEASPTKTTKFPKGFDPKENGLTLVEEEE